MIVFTKKLLSVLCSAFLLLNSSVSNSQELTGQITQHSMGDDGYVNVPLPFSFPFYGQTFNNSWMYDNGVVSFKQPGTQGALEPGQWSSQPFSNTMSGSYFIAPLWGDITPIWNVTSYTTQTDGSYMKYNWNSISDYYSGGTRLNTFSLTVRPDGTFSATYTGLNLNSSNISVGYVGDPTKNEFNQIYYASAGTNIQTDTISNWSAYTLLPPPQYPTQCTTNPLFSVECPGYTQSFALQNVKLSTPTNFVNETSTINNTSSTNNLITESSSNETIVSVTPITTTSVVTPTLATNSTPTLNNPQPKVGEVKQSNSTTSSNKTTTSQIANIIANEQSRVSSIERNAVERATQQTNISSLNSTQENNEIVTSTQSQNYTNNNRSSQQLNSIVNNSLQTNNNLNATTNFYATNEQSLINAQQNNNLIETQSLNENIISTNRSTQIQEFSRIDTTERIVSNLEKELLNQNSTIQQIETKQETSNISVNQKVRDNELAGGISLASIVRQPVGFEAYMASIPDVKFYAPKEIYKGQQTVDNRNASRGLFGSNDARHAEMVNQQYK